MTQFTIDKAAFAYQSRECTGKRGRGTNGGPQNHFGLAALTTPERASAEYLGAARSPNLGGNIVLIQPSGNRGLQKLPLLLRPLQRSLHTNLRLPRVHAILKRQVLTANHKRVYRGMKVHGLLLDPPHQHW